MKPRHFAKTFKLFEEIVKNFHCVKSVRIRSYSGLHFPAFGLNTEYLSVFSLNAEKCGPE